jgi:hypothetical protein
MSYERKNTGNNSGFTGGVAPQPSAPLAGFSNSQQQFEQEAAAQKAAREGQAINSLQSIFHQVTAGPLSRQQGALRLIDMHERAKAILKGIENNPILTLTAHKLDNMQHSVFIPAVVIVGRDKANPDVAYAYTMMLEREEPMEPEVRTNQGFKTIIPVVSGNAWDGKYYDVVRKFVAKELNIDEKNVDPFSATVIGAHTELGVSGDYSKSTAVMNDMLFNATFAINTKIQETKGLPGYALTASSQNEVMTVESRFSRGLATDLVGRDKRADIDLTFSVKQHNPKSQSLNGQDGVAKVFGRMNGYIDFIGVTQENQATNWGGNLGQQQIVQRFNPLFVITSMFTDQAGTIEAQMAMLMAAATMAQGDEWVNSLYERHLASKRAGEKIDIGEIGGLNIEANLPQFRNPDAVGLNSSFGPVIDTRVGDFGRDQYINLIQQLCKQDLYLAIDCPNVGAESWYTDTFRSSAMKNQTGAIMADKIFKACNTLTGDRFATVFAGASRNTNLWLIEPIVIHNGYYHTPEGQRRDIRDIDTLAVANVLGSQDPTAMGRWAATFVPGVDTERALTVRKELIEQVAGGANNVVYTGYSTRLFLNPAVIKALLECARQIGFSLRFLSPYQNTLGAFQNTGLNLQGAMGLNSSNISGTFTGANGLSNVLTSNNYLGGGLGGGGL